jgi:phosphoglycerate dehydrogenase-like enzyme
VCSTSGAGRTDGIVLLPLADLLATSDVVSVHLRLSDECRGLLGRDRLRMMKPGSVLVNTARGAVVDQEALIEVPAQRTAVRRRARRLHRGAALKKFRR